MSPISRSMLLDADIEECQRTWGWLPPEPRAKPREDGPVMTLGEVAREMGISRQRAAQLEASALRKLRRWVEARGGW